MYNDLVVHSELSRLDVNLECMMHLYLFAQPICISDAICI